MNLITITEILGTLAFAISGIRFSAIRHFDWFGAYVVGLITATGGGTLRDLLLGVTPFWMLDGSYLITTSVALAIAIGFGKRLIRFNNTFFIFDTIGLALFVVVGFEKSIAEGFPYWVAVVMGTITGTVGSILRDVLINQEPLMFRKELYATACILGGMAYIIADVSGAARPLPAIITAAVVIGTRLLAVKYSIGLPTLNPVDDVES